MRRFGIGEARRETLPGFVTRPVHNGLSYVATSEGRAYQVWILLLLLLLLLVLLYTFEISIASDVLTCRRAKSVCFCQPYWTKGPSIFIYIWL